jgi:hypothetical protein
MAEKHRSAADGEADSGGQPDPLGELVKKYHVTLASVLVVSGAVAVVGLGVLAYALIRDPWSPGFALVGIVVLLCAGVLLVMNVFNVGRRLELRKRGLRFVEAGVETELFWDEIVDVEVNRTDDTNLGLATVQKRSSDAVRPSGLLTKTEWQVTIHTRDGRSVRLSRMFLRMVPDPKELISNLRMRSGVP